MTTYEKINHGPDRYSTVYSLHFDNKKYLLSPSEDITPYELWNLIKWIDELKCNRTKFKADEFYRRACELGISRHFKLKT